MSERFAQLFSIKGKVAVVTGGGRGIGQMIAAGFVDAGALVYISSRDAETCATTAAELSRRGSCTAFPENLGTLDGAERLRPRSVSANPPCTSW